MGYGGYLCTECVEVDGERYEKVTSTTCAKCIKPAYNILWILGFFAAILVYLGILIGINIWNWWGSITSVIFRIMTNYI